LDGFFLLVGERVSQEIPQGLKKENEYSNEATI
jgi:hypothetical protein